MKSYAKNLMFAIAFAELANALEHPSLSSSHDYQEKWSEVAAKNHAYRAQVEQLEYAEIDHGKRPVIGVLTEPLRGEMYTASNSRFKKDELVDTSMASYVPKAHV